MVRARCFLPVTPSVIGEILHIRERRPLLISAIYFHFANAIPQYSNNNRTNLPMQIASTVVSLKGKYKIFLVDFGEERATLRLQIDFKFTSNSSEDTRS